MSQLKIVHDLQYNQYAMPESHPVTCANPAPWRIEEVKIEFGRCIIWIRNKESMWFRADQCLMGSEKELKELYPGE